MQVKDFIDITNKLKSFKIGLERQGIIGQEQQTVLKILLAEMTANKINVSILKAI